MRFALELFGTGSFSSKLRFLWTCGEAAQQLALWQTLASEWQQYAVFADRCTSNDWKHLTAEGVTDVFKKLFEQGLEVGMIFTCHCGGRGGVMGCSGRSSGSESQNTQLEVMLNQSWTALWDEYRKVRSVESSEGLLMKCWKEQLRARVVLKDNGDDDGDAMEAQGEEGPTLDSLNTEALKVARDLCRQWGANGRGPKPSRSKAAPAASKVWMQRLQMHLQAHAEESKKLSRKHSNTPAPDLTLAGNVAGAAPAPDIAMETTTSAPAGAQDEPATQAAPAASDGGKRDMNGNSLHIGDIVIVTAKKGKVRYDQRLARVDRLNSRVAVVTFVNGPGKGDQLKVKYDNTQLEKAPVPHAKRLKLTPGDGVMCNTESASSAAPAAPAAPAVERRAESAMPTPDAACVEMFGDLEAYV